jgi:hypothetical protein
MASMVDRDETLVASDGSYREYVMAPERRRFTMTVTAHAQIVDAWIS